VQRDRRRRDAREACLELLDGIDAIVWEASLDGRTLELVSCHAERLLGSSSPEMLERDAWFERIPDTERQHWLEACLDAATTGEPVEVGHRLLTRTGEARQVTSRMRRFQAADGTNGLRGLTVEDGRTVLELQEQQERANTEAVLSVARRVAHDFGNILTSLMLSTFELRDALRRGEQLLEHLDNIDAALRRGVDAVDRITAFWRSAGVRASVVDVRGTLEDARRLLRALLPANVRVEISGGDCPRIRADAGRITHGVAILCARAARDLSAGGVVHVRLGSTGDQHASITVSWPGSDLVLPEASSFAAAADGGMLPLLVLRDIVDQHGGELTTRTASGVVDVELRFPAARASDAPVEAHRPRGAGRILVIDDDAQVAFDIGRVIRSLGYRATVMTNPQAALEWLAEPANRVDLLVSEANLDAMSGFELAARAAELQPALQSLLVSGTSDPEPLTGSVRGVLPKPLSADTLAQEIASLLGNEPGPDDHS